VSLAPFPITSKPLLRQRRYDNIVTIEMRIRESQITHIERTRQAAFEARAIEYIQRHWRGGVDDPALRLLVSAYLEDGFNYGFINEDDLIRFLDLRMTLRENWNSRQYVWVHDYLEEWSSPSVRIGHVIERLRFEGKRAG
jgi:hypothetical protein